ncbi:MAG: thioredoxin family protein [Colwellia sp.]|nr:thioredoxin family protein [Colwellia sp.]
MKKYVSVTIALIMSGIFVGCAHTDDSVDYAVGDVNQQELFSQYGSFSTSYQNFEITAGHKKQVKQWPSHLKIEVFFGTWCHDSQREVPRLLKVLQGNNQVDVVLIALDYQKAETQGRAQAAKVKYTPTFVVSLDGKEIGRIIERPKESLVDDISAMLVDI